MKSSLVIIFLLFGSIGFAQDFKDPFKLGNYYEYFFREIGQPPIRYSAKIVSEEIRNGLLYKKMEVYNEPPNTISNIYFSLNPYTLELFGGPASNCFDSTGNGLAINFSNPVGYIWNTCGTGIYRKSTITSKDNIYGYLNFNDSILCATRKDTLGVPIEGNTYYIFGEKFGYLYFYREYGSPLSNSPYEKYMVGAIIDGVTYGSILMDIHQIFSEIPEHYTLEQNYPNPFNPSTVIKFSLMKTSNVSLVVYDQLGREIQTLVNGRKNAGTYQYLFNANELSNGIYFYRLKADDFVETKKMMLIK